MRITLGTLAIGAVLAVSGMLSPAYADRSQESATPTAEAAAVLIDKAQLLAAGSVHGGLVLHLGCTTADLLLTFAADTRFLAQGISGDARVQHKLRSVLQAKQLQGRVSLIQLDSTRLPYNDKLVRYLIVEDALGIPRDELLRVLCPGGVLAQRTGAGWTTEVKPWPESFDEWTHIRHGADGNVVSLDESVGTPTNVRWIADSPSTSSLSQKVVIVSSAGRLFSVIGEKPTVLYARDAFSGMLLWERQYDVTLQKLRHKAFWNRSPLIAVGERVYIQGSALDSATGETVFSFEGEPLVCSAGVLITSQMRALNAATGALLWAHPKRAAAVVATESQVFLVEGEWPAEGGMIDLVCLDLEAGDEVWRQPFQVPQADLKPDGFDGYAPNTTPNGLLAGMGHHRGVLALEVSRTYIHLFTAADGKHLRSIRYKNWAPYAAGLRALMIDGHLWLAEHMPGESFDYGETINAYDLLTGELNKTLKLATPVRQRCRPPLATEGFMYLGGLNAVDLTDGNSKPVPLARSACGIGVVPANGLIYVPPTHCRCYSMIGGYVALESRGRMGSAPAQANMRNHLRIGFALGSVARSASGDLPPELDWPTFRQDQMRKAHIEFELADELRLLWNRKLVDGQQLGAPVIAGNTLLVADAARHRLDALDTRSGDSLWSFIADGPIVGSATISGGLCLFGCRDGWVYAVRLSDGELVWRNLAAPEQRQIIAAGQVESAWPVLSTVIVDRGVVCAVAGRHNMAEAGILLTGFFIHTGTKMWQRTLEHRPLNNLLTAGAYARKSLEPDPRPTSAFLGGWLVSDGLTVQVDRLGAADLLTGEVRAKFDARLDEPYTGVPRPLKNGADRSDFKPWLLSATDGEQALSYDLKALQFKSGEETVEFRVPGEVRSVASVADEWLILAEGELILLDKQERRVRRIVRFAGTAIQHGLALAHGRIFVVTEDGRVLCFGE